MDAWISMSPIQARSAEIDHAISQMPILALRDNQIKRSFSLPNWGCVFTVAIYFNELRRENQFP